MPALAANGAQDVITDVYNTYAMSKRRQLLPRLERTGGSMTSTSLRMEQDGAVVATALASFGRPALAPWAKRRGLSRPGPSHP